MEEIESSLNPKDEAYNPSKVKKLKTVVKGKVVLIKPRKGKLGGKKDGERFKKSRS